MASVSNLMSILLLPVLIFKFALPDWLPRFTSSDRLFTVTKSDNTISISSAFIFRLSGPAKILDAEILTLSRLKPE